MYIVVFWVDLLAHGDMLAASNILFLWYTRHLKNWYMSWKSIFVHWNLSQESIISKNVWLILLLDVLNCQAWLLLIKLKSSLIPSLLFMPFLLFISLHNADYRKTIKIIRHLAKKINVAFVLIDIHCMSIEGNPNLLQFYAIYTDMNILIASNGVTIDIL